MTAQPARAGTHVSGRTEVYQHRLDNPKCRDAKMHVIFSTICEAYGDWMSEGLVYSHHVTGMKGTITRINSCSNPNYTYPKMWHECYAMHNLPDKSGKVRNCSNDNPDHRRVYLLFVTRISATGGG